MYRDPWRKCICPACGQYHRRPLGLADYRRKVRAALGWPRVKCESCVQADRKARQEAEAARK